MDFIEMNAGNVNLAFKLFQGAIDRREMLYKACTQKEFVEIFLNVVNKEQINVSIMEAEGRAFASGCYVRTEDRAFITMILVDEKYRRRGFGKAILEELERRLRIDNSVRKLEIVFFNPMTLEWLIPGENGCDHPNAPGVDMGSSAYLFFKNCGYRDFAVQNSYYMDLQKYHMSERIRGQESELGNKDVVITIYDEKNHWGMEEMIRRFHNPLWERDILGEILKEDGGRPILIAAQAGRVCAFAGPLDVQSSGRGYFAGIGVDENYRGKGIAKVLFGCLCRQLKDMEAEYMTLFTGENNPARNIYEMTGFKIVRSWANMRKEVRDE